MSLLESARQRGAAYMVAKLQEPNITRWDGKAWRANEPLRHDKETTVADVVAYEIEELGNTESIKVVGDALTLYGHLPARRTIWVCETKVNAKYYGTPERLEIHGIIICHDSQNGYLVLQDER